MDTDKKMWHEKTVCLKDDKVVVKLFEEDGSFKKSILVPTIYYPLNGKYTVFHYKNTEKIENEEVLRIFDNVKYSIGHCYSNARTLVMELKEAGYDAKSYVGWLFTEKNEFPIHHCWVILDDKFLLDLSDDFTVMLSGKNKENFKNLSYEETQQAICSFHLAVAKVPNRTRCYPVGKPTSFLFYIGCECDPEEGILIYRRLLKQFPNHECQRNCDINGYNATQKVLKEVGLMK